jgi:hypothetical protein
MAHLVSVSGGRAMRKIVLLSFALTGCQMFGETDSSRIAAAEVAVRESLPNPGGARFGSERVTKTRVCGQVDVMNAFGGFPGFRPFAYDLATKKAVVLPERIATRQDVRDRRDFPRECLRTGG